MKPQPSAPNKSGVYWTQFLAHNLTTREGVQVDWTNHREAHKAIGRLFAPRLPGAAGERRAESGILYRVDAVAPEQEPSILVQSLVAPELTPRDSRTTEVSLKAWAFEPGDPVAFRISFNPVVRTSRYFSDAAKTKATSWSNISGASPTRAGTHRKVTSRILPARESVDWLRTRLDGSLDEIQITNHFRDRTESKPHLIAVDTIDGLARVTDSQALDALRLCGVGRARSYGCGLLTVTRLR